MKREIIAFGIMLILISGTIMLTACGSSDQLSESNSAVNSANNQSSDSVDTVEAGSQPSHPGNNVISADILGSWMYYMDAGVSGQALRQIEFNEDGTFNYAMAIAVSSGSELTSSTYATAASSQGKYKITGDNKVLLYSISGGTCKEDKYYDNLYEIIERTYSTRDIEVEDIEFTYTMENSEGETALILKALVEQEPGSLGFALLTEEYPLTRKK